MKRNVDIDVKDIEEQLREQQATLSARISLCSFLPYTTVHRDEREKNSVNNHVYRVLYRIFHAQWRRKINNFWGNSERLNFGLISRNFKFLLKTFWNFQQLSTSLSRQYNKNHRKPHPKILTSIESIKCITSIRSSSAFVLFIIPNLPCGIQHTEPSSIRTKWIFHSAFFPSSAFATTEFHWRERYKETKKNIPIFGAVLFTEKKKISILRYTKWMYVNFMSRCWAQFIDVHVYIVPYRNKKKVNAIQKKILCYC